MLKIILFAAVIAFSGRARASNPEISVGGAYEACVKICNDR